MKEPFVLQYVWQSMSFVDIEHGLSCYSFILSKRILPVFNIWNVVFIKCNALECALIQEEDTHEYMGLIMSMTLVEAHDIQLQCACLHKYN